MFGSLDIVLDRRMTCQNSFHETLKCSLQTTLVLTQNDFNSAVFNHVIHGTTHTDCVQVFFFLMFDSGELLALLQLHHPNIEAFERERHDQRALLPTHI